MKFIAFVLTIVLSFFLRAFLAWVLLRLAGGFNPTPDQFVCGIVALSIIPEAKFTVTFNDNSRRW